MRLSMGRIFLVLIAAAAFYAWQNLSRTSHETVVLHIPAVNVEDSYAILWVVEDRHHLWLRGENPQRRWLEHLQGGPIIELRRNGENRRYRANVLDTADAREYVDTMFRAKYGLADELRDLMNPGESVPVRLELP